MIEKKLSQFGWKYRLMNSVTARFNNYYGTNVSARKKQAEKYRTEELSKDQ